MPINLQDTGFKCRYTLVCVFFMFCVCFVCVLCVFCVFCVCFVFLWYFVSVYSGKVAEVWGNTISLPFKTPLLGKL